MTGDDAAEFLLAGAGAVALGTALLVDPTGWRRITRELQAWLAREGVREIGEVIGAGNAGYKRKAHETTPVGSG
jgi:dihydroorotate dehydrogenase (NAD+) catalytic subunit